MRIRIAMMHLCLTVLIPLSAAAVPPETDGCALAINNVELDPNTPNVDVFAGVPFDVAVAPQAGSGQWFLPTVAVELVAVPLAPAPPDVPPGGPVSWSQTVTQSFGGGALNPNRATAQLLIPYDLGNPNVPRFGDDTLATVTATVSEPLSNRKYRVAVCPGLVNVLGSPPQ